MFKRLIMLSLALTMLISVPAYAGQWMQENHNWRWQDDNGNYPKDQWRWLDGNNDGVSECYYFNGDGYLLTNTVTPDGYQVNCDGAWTFNHVVQVQVTGSDGYDDWSGEWEIIGQIEIPNQDITDKVQKSIANNREEDIDPYELAFHIVTLVNETRVARGKAVLEINDELMENAMLRAEEAGGYFSHTRPNGRSYNTAITVDYKSASENLTGGWPDNATFQRFAESAVEHWLDSEGHKRNLLNSKWNETGVGVYFTSSGYVVAQLFVEN